MPDFGVMTGPEELRIERILPGPMELVWEYLTDPVKRGTWLAPGPMELVVGGRVELHFRHQDLSPVQEPTPEAHAGGHTATGRITACEPPRLLRYTWGEGPDAEPSEVTFSLSPWGEEVLLAVTHRRLVSRGHIVSVAGGWHTHLGILADRLAGREPRPFWTAYLDLAGQYDKRLPLATLQRAPVAKAEMLVRRPVADVYGAFVDPAITSRFWFTKSSGRLEAGKRVRWEWEMYGAADDVVVQELVPNERIRVAFSDGTEAEWTFTARAATETMVTITNTGFTGTGDELVDRAVDAMGGFTIVLCGAKAWLEHGIALNLVGDKAPDAHVS